MDTESEVISRGNTPNKSVRDRADPFSASSSLSLNYGMECPHCGKQLTSDSLSEAPMPSALLVSPRSKPKSKVRTGTGASIGIGSAAITTTVLPTKSNLQRPVSKSTQRPSNALRCPLCDFSQPDSRDNSFFLSNPSSLSISSPSSSFPSPSPSSSSTNVSRPGTAVSRPGTAGGGGGISRVRSKIQAARDEKHFVDEELFRR
jgi:hypothetical protein